MRAHQYSQVAPPVRVHPKRLAADYESAGVGDQKRVLWRRRARDHHRPAQGKLTHPGVQPIAVRGFVPGVAHVQSVDRRERTGRTSRPGGSEMPARVTAFTERSNLDIPVVLDREKSVAKAWKVRALPT